MATITVHYHPSQLPWAGGEDIIINLFEKNKEVMKIVKRNSSSQVKKVSLSAYGEKLCIALENKDQKRTSRAYRSAISKIILFNKGKSVNLQHLTPEFLGKYENWLKKEGKTLNTVSFYMRNLRAIFNKAIEEGIIPYSNPFSKVSTGIYNTQKRALDKNDIFRLSLLHKGELKKDLTLNPPLLHSLKYFLFCFHARGMSFIDMSYLRKSNIRGNLITYSRKKTGRPLRIKITPPMREIMNYFNTYTKDSPYVFPIIDPNKPDERAQYESALTLQNYYLKLLGRIAGVKQLLTTHVARHSWATMAKQERIPTAIISEALGHRDEKTTSIYLDSFSDSVIFGISEQISRIFNKTDTFRIL